MGSTGIHYHNIHFLEHSCSTKAPGGFFALGGIEMALRQPLGHDVCDTPDQEEKGRSCADGPIGSDTVSFVKFGVLEFYVPVAMVIVFPVQSGTS